MTPAYEYLCRHRLIENIIPKPFSIFYSGLDQNIVVTVHEAEGRLISRHWMLDLCLKTSVLPPMNEYYCQSLDDPHIKFDWSLPERLHFVPNRLNLVNHKPMSKFYYDWFVDRFIMSEDFAKEKIGWLWNCFFNLYEDSQLKTFLPNNLFRQQEYIKYSSPKTWRKWKSWEKNMLPVSYGEVAVFPYLALGSIPLVAESWGASIPL